MIETLRTIEGGQPAQMKRAAFGLWIIGTLLLVTCSNPQPSSQHTLVFSRIVDLSHVITQDMPHLPGEPLTHIVRPSGHAIAQGLHISVASGTHVSTPARLNGRLSVDRLSPRDLIMPAVVLDVRDSAQDNAEYQLSVREIRTWERRHGRIPAGSIVLLATGWDMRWGSPTEYLNLNEDQVPVVPGFGSEAAAWLLHERNVGGLGIDTPAIDGYHLTSTSPSKQALAAQRLLLKNLTNLEQLSPTGTTVIIGALKIQAGAGSPARVLALVP